jgi:hypothetical protein
MQNPNDVMSVGRQPRAQRSSDQTRRAGDENPHPACPEKWDGRRASTCLDAEPDENTKLSSQPGHSIRRSETGSPR